MGKGDKRTRKGKIWRGSYGVSRPRTARNEAVVVISKEEKEAKLAAKAAKQQAAAEKAAKKAAPKAKKEEKKAAPKKSTPKKEAAPKKEAVKKKPAPKAVKKAKADDLKKIEGIGPKIAETLAKSGIATFAELAVANPTAISEIIAGVRGNHVPDTWPQQAKLAADGKWDELQVLQDELDGGKKK